jgi:hypothetical protein
MYAINVTENQVLKLNQMTIVSMVSKLYEMNHAHNEKEKSNQILNYRL